MTGDTTTIFLTSGRRSNVKKMAKSYVFLDVNLFVMAQSAPISPPDNEITTKI